MLAHKSTASLSYLADITRVNTDGSVDAFSSQPASMMVSDAVSHILGRKVVLGSPEQKGTPSDVGLDSLGIVRVRNRLQKATGYEIPRDLFAPNSCWDALIQYLESRRSSARSVNGCSRVEPSSSTSAKPAGVPVPWSSQQRRWRELVPRGLGHRVIPVEVKSPLDESRLLVSFDQLIRKHETLRINYANSPDDHFSPNEVISAWGNTFVDLRKCAPEELALRLRSEVDILYRDVPNIFANQPSWRLRCAALSDDRFLLLFSVQHIEMDGRSFSVLLQELRELYSGAAQQHRQAMPAVRYAEYTRWQRQYANDNRRRMQAVLNRVLPSDVTIPIFPNYQESGHATGMSCVSYSVVIPRRVWLRAKTLAKVAGLSDFALIVASYAKAVGVHTGRTHIVMGSIFSGRSDPRFADTIGPFTAPMPFTVSTQPPILDIAKDAYLQIMELVELSDYPVSEFYKMSPIFGDHDFCSYFADVMINYTNYKRERESSCVPITTHEIIGHVTHPIYKELVPDSLRYASGLHLTAEDLDSGLALTFWRQTGRVSSELVKQIGQSMTEELEETVRMAKLADHSETERQGG